MPRVQRSRAGRRKRQGNALMEMAISLPVLVLLCVGAADFARTLFNAVTAVDGAYAGATFGSLRGVNSALPTVMEQTARQSATDIDKGNNSLTVSADRYCDCPSSPASGPADYHAVSCTTGTCSGYGPPRVYVRTRMFHNFNSAAPYPGVTDGVKINKSCYMRVQ